MDPLQGGRFNGHPSLGQTLGILQLDSYPSPLDGGPIQERPRGSTCKDILLTENDDSFLKLLERLPDPTCRTERKLGGRNFSIARQRITRFQRHKIEPAIFIQSLSK